MRLPAGQNHRSKPRGESADASQHDCGEKKWKSLEFHRNVEARLCTQGSNWNQNRNGDGYKTQRGLWSKVNPPPSSLLLLNIFLSLCFLFVELFLKRREKKKCGLFIHGRLWSYYLRLATFCQAATTIVVLPSCLRYRYPYMLTITSRTSTKDA